ncbi:class I fructose-bisphosphate aldolase [Hydrocarboniclastica marina]|uniref:Probable fructose-bisphosphate aldolase class 1 n=1 Tax=Hydrocarboniclastica marina TaxID=2259620 RepID=A0A4P7XKX6_9ALTE|nr:class I fructose-bisphosphate aldolase [Hydrocarboniclastica marina]QCF27012.1 fructose-bisphosphate aldolase class I [Hydrocarboniclastica marina]
MEHHNELQRTIDNLVSPRKGLLAADESHPTIAKRFAAIDLEPTEENRRAYRSLLLTTPGINEFISGVILFEETVGQLNSAGDPLVHVLETQGIVPGVKVDKGKGPLPNAPGDMITHGLDGLEDRLDRYREQGIRFAKWREVYPISDQNPTSLGLEANAEVLARYAAACQQAGIVPIVEPEVLRDGTHDMGRCEAVHEAVLESVFRALRRHGVTLEHMLLKPAMITPGEGHDASATPEEVAEATLRLLTRCVPAAVPGVNFLSGGQTPVEATRNLNALNVGAGNVPWRLSFSYGRALQEPVLNAWKGRELNAEVAQQAFLLRAGLNSAACEGAYSSVMEA